VTQTKNKGNGTPWLTETFLYDGFGNVKQKTISGTGITPRTEKFEYDSSGRFLTKSIDIEGLASIYTYNTRNGNPLTSKNPYGLTTKFVYDAWQRLLKETKFRKRNKLRL